MQIFILQICPKPGSYINHNAYYISDCRFTSNIVHFFSETNPKLYLSHSTYLRDISWDFPSPSWKHTILLHIYRNAWTKSHMTYNFSNKARVNHLSKPWLRYLPVYGISVKLKTLARRYVWNDFEQKLSNTHVSMMIVTLHRSALSCSMQLLYPGKIWTHCWIFASMKSEW